MAPPPNRPKFTHLHHGLLASFGLCIGWFFTRAYTHILRPSLANTLPHLTTPNPAPPRCFDELNVEINTWLERAKLSA
jgi:hypothetical protein